jgi:hypothetical protein
MSFSNLSEFGRCAARSRYVNQLDASGGGCATEVVIKRGERQSFANRQFQVGGVIRAEPVSITGRLAGSADSAAGAARELNA